MDQLGDNGGNICPPTLLYNGLLKSVLMIFSTGCVTKVIYNCDRNLNPKNHEQKTLHSRANSRASLRGNAISPIL